MKSIFVMRHAKAKPKEEDANRPINEVGRVETGRIAEFLAEKNIKFHNIYHSTKQRTKDTALVVNEITGSNINLIETDNLSPAEDPNNIFNELKGIDGNTLIVGHLPYVSNFVGSLVTDSVSYEIVNFEPSTILKLSKTDDNWIIDWVITPTIIK